MKRACLCAGICWLFSIWACSPTPESLRRGLERLSASELKEIEKHLEKKGIDSLLSDNPYFEIVEFKVFSGDSGRVFRAYAQVHYHYLKTLKLCQKRKYRYSTDLRSWQRYEAKLKHVYSKPEAPHDSLANKQ